MIEFFFGPETPYIPQIIHLGNLFQDYKKRYLNYHIYWWSYQEKYRERQFSYFRDFWPTFTLRAIITKWTETLFFGRKKIIVAKIAIYPLKAMRLIDFINSRLNHKSFFFFKLVDFLPLSHKRKKKLLNETRIGRNEIIF